MQSSHDFFEMEEGLFYHSRDFTNLNASHSVYDNKHKNVGRLLKEKMLPCQ